ncbi:MAG: 23S rRNA (adenine(2503)-C(2))-methyltransferase RlmN [Synechococcales cyanobacterium]
MVPLLGQSLPELQQWATQHDQPAYRGQQIYDWIYRKGVRELSAIPILPKAWRTQVQDYPVGRSQVAHRAVSVDGTIKFLLQLHDGLRVETVGIPSPDRLSVCVSSQVGCPMACDFCATGKSGWQRHLATHEIVDQVLTVQEAFQRRVSHIVFMGMGEPLLNQEAVVAAIHCLHRDLGISQRRITVSTVGIPQQIARFAQHDLAVTLAVSLHAPNQALRCQLIPSAQHYPLEALMQDCHHYVQTTGRRISFEYIVLGGLNDRPEHARELAGLLRGLQAHVNLIPYNPIAEVDYQRPSPAHVRQFAQHLQERHIAVTVRQTRGLDQDAACGQLRRRLETA